MPRNHWRNKMSEKNSPTYAVLHLRFKLRVPPHEFLAHSREAAIRIASVDGLIWKIWVVEEEKFEMGGMYLFANRESAVAYLNHPAIMAMCSNPIVVSTKSQLWDVEGSLSALTRGPLPDGCARYLEPDAVMAGGR
jgi:hypothetical protein